MSFEILQRSATFTDDQLEGIEDYYKAKYLFDTTHESNDNVPISIFYTEIPHPEGSNFFGIYYKGRDLMITNGYDMATTPMNGILIDGCVLHSRFRHDYATEGDKMIDGGRAYLRTNNTSDIVFFKASEKGVICLV